MASTSTLPDNPVYAFCPEYAPPARPQQGQIVFEDLPGDVPTGLVALSLPVAERLCSQLNARIRRDRDACMKFAARATRGDSGPSGPTRQ